MKASRLLLLSGISLSALAASPDGFVLVKGGALRAGENIDAFEMQDHPVTNAEYKLFVDDSHHVAPLFWAGGHIPKGMENYPVVFVNRFDAVAYVTWRTRKEHRIYRLLTAAEFQFAATSGRTGQTYPWGDGQPSAEHASSRGTARPNCSTCSATTCRRHSQIGCESGRAAATRDDQK